MQRSVNARDLGVKVFWTVAEVVGGLLIVELADWHHAFAVPVVAVITWGVAYARQRAGGPPPDAREVNARRAASWPI